MAIRTVDTTHGAGRGTAHIFVEYRLDRVCAVCQVQREIRPDGGERSDLEQLYADVGSALNRRIAFALFGPGAERLRREFYGREPALRPTLLEQQFQGFAPRAKGGDQPPQFLGPPDEAPVGGQRTPWTFLRPNPKRDGGPGTPATAICFYQIRPPAADPNLPEDVRVRHQLERVREMTNLVNLTLPPLGQEGEAGGENPAGFAVQAVHPIWLMTGAPCEGGSPGAAPRAAKEGDWRFQFVDRNDPNAKNVELQRRIEGIDESNVLVAVLDSSPTRQQIVDAAEACFPKNWLLQRVSQEAQAGASFVVDRDDPASPLRALYDESGLEELLPNWGDRQPGPGAELGPYRIADHGLFVAGIVRAIAPFAKIRLVRVLNDFCLGDMGVVTRVLQKLPAVLDALPEMAGKQKRLVVNLSLGSDVPPGDELPALWYPTLRRELQTVLENKIIEAKKNGGDLPPRLDEHLDGALAWLATCKGPEAATAALMGDLLAKSHLGLQATVAWLADEHDALIVAAAGNDYGAVPPPTALRHEPRYPAHYEDALGVAAINVKGEPSSFSNRGDEPDRKNGVATFGGDAHRLAPGTLPIIEDDDVGIVGIYSSSTLPLLPSRGNPHRWVAWAGTSFSTPIASAIAAKLLGEQPNLGHALIDAVMAVGNGGVVGDLSVRTIPVRQVQ